LAMYKDGEQTRDNITILTKQIRGLRNRD